MTYQSVFRNILKGSSKSLAQHTEREIWQSCCIPAHIMPYQYQQKLQMCEASLFLRVVPVLAGACVSHPPAGINTWKAWVILPKF